MAIKNNNGQVFKRELCLNDSDHLIKSKKISNLNFPITEIPDAQKKIQRFLKHW